MPLQTWLNKNNKNSQNIDKLNLTNKLSEAESLNCQKLFKLVFIAKKTQRSWVLVKFGMFKKPATILIM